MIKKIIVIKKVKDSIFIKNYCRSQPFVKEKRKKLNSKN